MPLALSSLESDHSYLLILSSSFVDHPVCHSSNLYRPVTTQVTWQSADQTSHLRAQVLSRATFLHKATVLCYSAPSFFLHLSTPGLLYPETFDSWFSSLKIGFLQTYGSLCYLLVLCVMSWVYHTYTPDTYPTHTIHISHAMHHTQNAHHTYTVLPRQHPSTHIHCPSVSTALQLKPIH